MAKNKLVSIAVPSFNTRADYLAEAIDSVGLQEGVDIGDVGLIIIDDKSDPGYRDGIERVVAEKRMVYPDLDITLNSNRFNKGIGGARNTAIHISNGEFVGILDDDDALEPLAIAKTIKKMREGEYALVFTDHTKYNEGLTEVYYTRQKAAALALHEQHKGTIDDPLFHFSFPGHFRVYRRSVLDQVEGYRDQQPCEDWDLFLRIAHLSGEPNFGHVSEPLHRYRNNPDSVTNGKFKSRVQKTAGNIARTFRELGYPVIGVRYAGTFSGTGSAFYDVLISGQPYSPSWAQRNGTPGRIKLIGDV